MKRNVPSPVVLVVVSAMMMMFITGVFLSGRLVPTSRRGCLPAGVLAPLITSPSPEILSIQASLAALERRLDNATDQQLFRAQMRVENAIVDFDGSLHPSTERDALAEENRRLKKQLSSPGGKFPDAFAKLGGWKVVGWYRGANQWPTMNGNSQVGQDATVMEIFADKRSGFFVDLAANDASHFSNTVQLEQRLGWNGLCVEANPRYLPGLMERRCQLAFAAAGRTTGEKISFAERRVFSGIVGSEFDIKQEDDTKKVQEMTTVKVADIFRQFSVPAVIDYMSLDIEGAEVYCFKDFPWDQYRFRVLTVERPGNLTRILEENGYVYVRTHGDFGDDLFMHKSFPHLQDVLARFKSSRTNHEWRYSAGGGRGEPSHAAAPPSRPWWTKRKRGHDDPMQPSNRGAFKGRRSWSSS
jgi:hypothetical protein